MMESIQVVDVLLKVILVLISVIELLINYKIYKNQCNHDSKNKGESD